MNRLDGDRFRRDLRRAFQRIPLLHGFMETGGYRFGNAAYLTDMNIIPDASLALLEGVEVVVIDALRDAPTPPTPMSKRPSPGSTK
jgi:phosphoribosyl 1,2-cyclic phosphate phosphodiesterase